MKDTSSLPTEAQGINSSGDAAAPTVGETAFSIDASDNYDMHKMHEISLEEENEESGETGQPKKDEVPTEVKKEAKKETAKAPDEEDSEEEGTPAADESETGESEASEESLEETEDFITVKDGEKDRKISRDAKVEVKINGKKESMTLQEALNKASGAINVERENTRLGREKKTFEDTVKRFKEEASIVNGHAQALLDMEDPYEFCEYYAALKGLNPDEVYKSMIERTFKVVEEWSEMTPRERQLQMELRKHKRLEKQNNARARLENDTREAATKRDKILNSVKSAGLDPEEYESALAELAEKAANGESLGDLDKVENLTEHDVIKYAILSNTNKRVLNAVTTLGGEETAKDTNFISKLVKALTKSESLHGKFTDTEVSQFVKEAMELDKKTLRENLSKKVEQKKTASKSVNSRKQEEDEEDDEYDITMDEYENRSRYDY